ncbi:RDD family protein [Glaciecola sp. MH2013]|nr:RDD family protein [Glaciecola sp. MH2013]
MESLMDLASAIFALACAENEPNKQSATPQDTQAHTSCIVESAEGLAIAAAAMPTPIEDVKASAADLVAQQSWQEQNKLLFLTQFNTTLEEEKNAYTEDVLAITQAEKKSEETSSTSYSVINWVKGVMSDLGLGLGWAALYFTVFTAWWRGQTIGKKVLGIEVVKLDGNYPSLWESFGRYGGYGAGFATGLLGFLQIYWDPNRQAIQDKISETLVLRLGRKP